MRANGRKGNVPVPVRRSASRRGRPVLNQAIRRSARSGCLAALGPMADRGSTLTRSLVMAVTMRQMLEAGVHFGHQTRYWNPKMADYIFGQRNKIHIVNLEKTMAIYQEALKFVRQLATNRGTILFVATKRQARDIIAEEAQRASMPYVDHRWLGGMLTN